jgi:hypothetical protein
MELLPSLRSSCRGRLCAEQNETYEPRHTTNKSRLIRFGLRELRAGSVTVESTMGHGLSQIGYLSNCITGHGLNVLRSLDTLLPSSVKQSNGHPDLVGEAGRRWFLRFDAAFVKLYL